jgi:hypothetical protein
VKSQTFTRNFESRRHFIGGLDARIIMSGDEAALIRLWTGDHSRARAAKSPTAQAQFLRPFRGKYSRASRRQRQTAAKLTTFMSGIRRLLKAYAILWQKLCAGFRNTLSINANESWDAAERPTSMFVIVFR